MDDIFGATGPVRTGVGSIYDYTAPSLDVLAATGEEAWAFNPVPALLRYTERKAAEGRGEMLSAEQARQRVADEELPLTIPDGGMSEPALEILMDTKRDEIKRKQVMARSSGGIGLGAAQFGVGLAVSFADPINIASGFVPVGRMMGAANALKNATTPTARALSRTKFGAVEGAVGAVIVEPLVYGLAQSEQADYTINDSLLNVAFGTIMGGGLHAGVGAIGDSAARRRATSNAVTRLIEELPVEDRPEVYNALVAQVMSDRTPDGAAVINALNIRNQARGTQSARQAAAAISGMETANIPRVDGDFISSNVIQAQLDAVRAEINANTRAAVRGDILEGIDDFADAAARKRDPALFKKADELDTKIDTHRRWLDDLRAGKANSPEVQLIRSEIARSEQALGRTKDADKLRKKKMTQKITTLNKRLDKITGLDTPDQTRVRKALVKLEQQRRDMGVDISKVTQKASNEIKSGKVKKMSLELSQDINTVLHEREIELENQLGEAMNREIASHSYRPDRGKSDMGSDEGIGIAARDNVETARRDADRANQWESGTFVEPEALADVETTIDNVKDQTVDDLDVETDDILAIMDEEKGELDVDLLELEEFDIVDEDAFTKALDEYATCMVSVA